MLPLPIPTTFAGLGKCSCTAAWAANRFAFSMVDSVDGLGKTSFFGGAGLEESRLEDVQPDQEAFVEVISAGR